MRIRLAAALDAMPRVVLCALAGAGAGSALAQAQAPLPAWSQNAENTQELHGWLNRIHEAATRINYEGTLVNYAGGTVVSSHVAHYCEGRNEWERIDALDGETRGMLRINGEMHTLWPRLRLEVVEPVDPRAAFPVLVSGSQQHVPDFYELHEQAGDRIAGHDAVRLLLKARDRHRFDHVIWTDRATGLLLRVDVQDEGRTLESSAFSDVRIGVRPQPEAIYGALHRAAGFRVLRPPMEPTRLEAEGWSMAGGSVPPGFQALGCVRRGLPLPAPDAAEPQVLQAIFSDGLTHVSVFIEPFQPQRHKSAGLTVIGATHTLSRRRDDFWLTAVGDVPQATLEQFFRALERKP